MGLIPQQQYTVRKLGKYTSSYQQIGTSGAAKDKHHPANTFNGHRGQNNMFNLHRYVQDKLEG